MGAIFWIGPQPRDPLQLPHSSADAQSSGAGAFELFLKIDANKSLSPFQRLKLRGKIGALERALTRGGDEKAISLSPEVKAEIAKRQADLRKAQAEAYYGRKAFEMP